MVLQSKAFWTIIVSSFHVALASYKNISRPLTPLYRLFLCRVFILIGHLATKSIGPTLFCSLAIQEDMDFQVSKLYLCVSELHSPISHYQLLSSGYNQVYLYDWTFFIRHQVLSILFRPYLSIFNFQLNTSVPFFCTNEMFIQFSLSNSVPFFSNSFSFSYVLEFNLPCLFLISFIRCPLSFFSFFFLWTYFFIVLSIFHLPFTLLMPFSSLFSVYFVLYYCALLIPPFLPLYFL